MSLKLIQYKDLYEKIHFHELEARERVSGRLQISLSLILALASGLAYLFQSTDFKGAGNLFRAFAVVFGVSCCAFGCGAYHLVRVFWGNYYKEIPSAQAIRDQEVALHNYHHTPPVALPTEAAQDEAFANAFDEFVIKKFVNSATNNATVNDFRAVSLHKANRMILVTGGLGLTAFVLFTIGDLAQHKPQKVVLVAPATVNVLAAAAGCGGGDLTCGQVGSQICHYGSGPLCDQGNSPNERQNSHSSAPTDSASTSAAGPTGATDKGGRSAGGTVVRHSGPLRNAGDKPKS